MDDAEFLARCTQLWRTVHELDAVSRQNGCAMRDHPYRTLALALDAFDLVLGTIVRTDEWEHVRRAAGRSEGAAAIEVMDNERAPT